MRLKIGLSFILCLSIYSCNEEPKKSTVHINASDKVILEKSINLLKDITTFDTLTFNPLLGSSLSKKFHIAAIKDISEFPSNKRNQLVEKINSSNQIKTVNENDLPYNTYLNQYEENEQVLNFAEIIYSDFKGIENASTIIYWYQTKNNWVGAYFYFEKDSTGGYNPILVYQSDLPDIDFTQKQLNKEIIKF